MNNLKPFIYYDWEKTILKNTKENYSINEIIPKTFLWNFMEPKSLIPH